MNIRQISHEEIIAEANYDDCVNLGKQVQDDVDLGRFKIGDIGIALKKRYKDDKRQWYGNGVLDEFAKDIQRGKKTIQEYCSMSKFWTPEKRQYVIERYAVNYSVMKVAKRFKTHRRAEAFLRLCSSEGVNTVDDYARRAGELKGGKPKPKKVARIDMRCTRSEDGKLTLHADNIPPEILQEIELGKMYTIDIYSIEE